MKMKKIILAMLALVMTASSMTGCGVEKENTGDEPVVLRWVMPGAGRQKDTDMVMAELNKKIQEKLPNVTLEVETIQLADYKQRIMLMQTGKEKMDIVNTYTLTYSDEVSNGSFVELTDLLDKYGKETKEALPEWLFDYMKVDGGLYAIPTYQANANRSCFVFQKDYAEKYLDIEGLKNELYSNNYVTDKTIEYIEDYFTKLEENGLIQYGSHHYIDTALKGYETVVGNFMIDNFTHEVVYKFEMPEIKKTYERHANWYKKGWIRKDALSANDDGAKKGARDGYVLYESGYNDFLEESLNQKGEGEWLTIPYTDFYFIPMINDAGGTAISTSCEHPEEAMQLINLFQTDKELLNMLMYGIEGVHYTKISDDQVETPYAQSGSSSDDYGLTRYVLGNTELLYVTQNMSVEQRDFEFNVINKSEHRSELIGFVPNLDNVSDQIAQLDAMKGEFMKTLATGALGDGWADYYDEWMQKANAAGLQEVKKELQAQVDEFLANK